MKDALGPGFSYYVPFNTFVTLTGGHGKVTFTRNWMEITDYGEKTGDAISFSPPRMSVLCLFLIYLIFTFSVFIFLGQSIQTGAMWVKFTAEINSVKKNSKFIYLSVKLFL
jgi:hypothetical protein